MLVVYLDLVFALNFAVNFLLLRGTARLGAASIRNGRLCIAAAVGAAYAVVGYFGQFLLLWPFKLLCAVGMLICAFGFRKSTLRLGAVFGAVTLVLCGAVFALQLLGGRRPAGQGLLYPVSFGSLLLTAGAVSAACRLLLPKLTHASDSIVPVILQLGSRTVRITALRDSGNTLTDPISGGAVLVAAWRCGAELLHLPLTAADFAAPDRLAVRLRDYHPRLIPYRAVGVTSGLLLALPCRITMDRVTKTGLVAFCPTPLSDGGAYEALTNGTI